MAPKYEVVAEKLREAITADELKPGDLLPPQPVLAKRYRVSLPTIQSALRILEGEGLIDQLQGIGTQVRRPPRRQVHRHADRYLWEKRRARESPEKRRETGAVEHDTGL